MADPAIRYARMPPYRAQAAVDLGGWGYNHDDNSGKTFDHRMRLYWHHDLGLDTQRRHTISQGEDIVYSWLTLGQHEDTTCTISQRHQVLIELDSRSRLGKAGLLQRETGQVPAKEKNRAL